MDALYSWTAKRAGAAVTVEHSTGKITGIDNIEPNRLGQVIAQHRDGRAFVLATAPHQDAETDRVNGGVSDLFFNNEQACEAAQEAGYPDEPSEAMVEAAKGFQIMLRAAGLAPPTVAALWRDFLDRV